MSQEAQKETIFPRDPHKTYGLMELVRGTSPMVDKGPENTVFSFPIVAIIEVLLTLGTLLLLILFSVLRNAPLEEMANPDVTTNPAKAPWYFVGLQELLLHMHPALAGVIVPTILVLFLLALPYLDTERHGAGVWFGSSRAKWITFWSALYGLVVMTGFILFDEFVGVQELFPGAPARVVGIAIPALALAVFVILPWLVLRARSATTREVVIALFTLMLASALVVTISGFLFRGPGMHLYLPWQMPDGYNPLDSL
jgi:hypothetical protein